MTPLTVGSLFSGIGGIELGLERTGGFKTIWNCENDAYASAVLRKYWPAVPNLGDVQRILWEKIERPNLICGGFPCQDISLAGKGAGIKEGTRSGLWLEYAKAIRVLRPKYALIENVSALSNRGLHLVLADLAEARYNAEWFIIRASDVGAPHRRERLFIIAYANDGGHFYGEPEIDSTKDREPPFGKFEPSILNADGDKLGIRGKQSFAGNDEENVLFADNRGKRISWYVKRKIRRFKEFSWCENVRRVEDFKDRADIPKPLFCGTRDGIPYWVDRIKCLGNAVVPQVAQVIGEAILEFDKQEVG